MAQKNRKESNTIKLAQQIEKYTPNMRVVHKEVDLSTKFNKFRMYLASDWHMGTTGEILKPIKEFCALVEKDPAGFLTVNGDLFNLSKEGQQRDVLSIDQIVDIYVEILSPLAEQRKLLFVLDGNHDRRLLNSNDVDLIKQIVERLKVKYNDVPMLGINNSNSLENTAAPYYATATFYIRREDTREGKLPINFLFHHGDGMKGIDSLINLYNIVPGYSPDFIVCGHTHQPALKTDRCTYRDEKTNETFKKKVTSIITKSVGSPTYADEKNYAPNEKGAGIVMEISTSKNPLFGYPMQPEYLIVSEEVKDKIDLDTRIKEACVEVASFAVTGINYYESENQIAKGKKWVDEFLKWQKNNTSKVVQSLKKVKKYKAEKEKEETQSEEHELTHE